MTVVRLEDWKVGFTDSDAQCYLPPEQRARSIVGKVYGDPKRADGTVVTTNSIHRVDGRRVVTRSGSVYHLGEVNGDYLRAMQGRGYRFDPENPIKGWK